MADAIRWTLRVIFGAIFLCALWLSYQGLFSTTESLVEMEERAELWCEARYGARPALPLGKPELTEFDDCVDAEVRLYAGSAFFGPLISGIVGGLILFMYVTFWGIRFAWRRRSRRKRMRQNPYN